MESKLSSLILRVGTLSNKLLHVRSNTYVRCARTLTDHKKTMMSTQAAVQLDNEVTKDVTSDITNPLDHADYFNVRNMFTIEDLFNARVHYGHKEGSLDERMKPFLFGSRLGHTIFDLDKTAELLKSALNITSHIAYRGGIVLFISQYPQHSVVIENTAKDCGEYAHTRVWRTGMLTNSNVMYGAVTRLPDLCIFLNTLTTVLDQHFAVTEAAKMLIPTIGIVDSNCNPNLITYPVPGNDDSAPSIELYCRLFKEAVLRGKRVRQKVLGDYKKQLEKEE